MKLMRLASAQFKAIVQDTVLVSLDLLFINERNEVLVGRRKHGPARNYLFVPGWRVMKGGTLAAALRRVAEQETRLSVSPDQIVLHGIYAHIYDDSCFEDTTISTQYVVITCSCAINSDAPIDLDQQHEDLHFVPIADLIADPHVHPYTQRYLQEHAENLFLSGLPLQHQWTLLNRRVSLAGATREYARAKMNSVNSRMSAINTVRPLLDDAACLPAKFWSFLARDFPNKGFFVQFVGSTDGSYRAV